MTNKEAYEILEKYIRCSNNECPPVDCDECHHHVAAKQLDEALQMALEALKEPEQPDHIVGVSKKDGENGDDLIRREDALMSLTGEWTESRDEILSKAIRRIKRLPSVQPESCGDAVSRNAIIRALNTMDRYVSDELTLCDTDRKFPKNEVFIVDDVYEEIAENLPSVQPDRKPGRWIRVSADKYTRSAEYVYRCSECGNNTIGMPRFCPDCGTKMKGES